MHKYVMTAIAVFLSIISAQSQAIMIISNSAGSTNQLGAFELSATWDGNSLNLDITNTSEGINGGYITGLLLNLPDNVTYNSMSFPNEFDFLWHDLGPFDGTPFGHFDYGFNLIGNDPSLGIGVGETGHFGIGALNNLPTGSNQWSSEDFEYYLLQDDTTPSVTDAHLLVKFSGFNHGGQDQVPSFISAEDGPSDPQIQIPILSTIWLMISGLFCNLLYSNTRLTLRKS